MKIERKNKELTPEQAKRKLYFSGGLIAFMLLTILIASLTRKVRGEKEYPDYSLADTVTVVMDAQMDSIILLDYPEGTKITKKREISVNSMRNDRAVELESINTRIEYLEEKAAIDGWEDNMTERLTQLQQRRNEIKKERRYGKKDYYTRRLEVTTPEGKKVYGIQATEIDLSKSHYVYRSTTKGNEREIMDRAENNLKTK